jgi:competence protein ComGC
MTINNNLIRFLLVVFFISIITIVSQVFVLRTTYDDDTNALASKIHMLYEDNAKLQYQIDHQPSIKDLKTQLKLVEDGASIEEAKLIIEQSKEVGLSPKL